MRNEVPPGRQYLGTCADMQENKKCIKRSGRRGKRDVMCGRSRGRIDAITRLWC